MKLFRILKNKIMSNEQKIEGRQFYVWIRSERIGQIVEVAETQTDPKWLKFTDGTQCNTTLVNEFLMPASSEDQANLIAKDFGGITTFIDPANATPVRPRRDAEPSAEVNVMQEMLKKMSAKNKADMPVQINIPSKEIYALLKDQMDITKKDLNSQIVALVESQIDNLRDSLKEQIESFINNYYNGRTTNSRTGSTTDTTESGNSES